MSGYLDKLLKLSNEGILQAVPVKSNGSGDFSSLNESTGFLELPEGKEVFEKGQAYSIYFWKGII